MTRYVTGKQSKGSSTGTRVSQGRFKPSSPKGGFLESGYEAAKQVGYQYGYDPEAYYRKRLFGVTPDDSRWRYDLNQYILGRPKKRRETDAFPTWGKKQWNQASNPVLQKGHKPNRSGYSRRSTKYLSKYRNGQRCCWPNKCYRYRRSYRLCN